MKLDKIKKSTKVSVNSVIRSLSMGDDNELELGEFQKKNSFNEYPAIQQSDFRQTKQTNQTNQTR